MPKITAISPINHSGKQYAAGDVFEVNDSEADYLVGLGAAKVDDADKAPAKAVAKPKAEPKTATD